MPQINNMTVQSDGSRPHVTYIMRTLAEYFPNFIWKIGGMVPRTTWTGGHSAHADGRACDIYLDANDPIDLRFADKLFAMFQAQGIYLKVDHTIWNGNIWTRVTRTQPAALQTYTGGGGPHRDHIHVAFVDDHLDLEPYYFDSLCRTLTGYLVNGPDGLSERHEGLWGQAFDPARPLVRLSHKQRKAQMLRMMQMEGA